jgi:hypothetical protein
MHAGIFNRESTGSMTDSSNSIFNKGAGPRFNISWPASQSGTLSSTIRSIGIECEPCHKHEPGLFPGSDVMIPAT